LEGAASWAKVYEQRHSPSKSAGGLLGQDMLGSFDGLDVDRKVLGLRHPPEPSQQVAAGGLKLGGVEALNIDTVVKPSAGALDDIQHALWL
jgi:hypothetical protein